MTARDVPDELLTLDPAPFAEGLPEPPAGWACGPRYWRMAEAQRLQGEARRAWCAERGVEPRDLDLAAERRRRWPVVVRVRQLSDMD